MTIICTCTQTVTLSYTYTTIYIYTHTHTYKTERTVSTSLFPGAWVRSKACSQFIQNGTDPKFLFNTRVAAIAAEEGLNLGAWEDGLMDSGEPIPRDDMRPREVFANAWQNVWEWGLAARAYVLANEGYKVMWCVWGGGGGGEWGLAARAYVLANEGHKVMW